MSIGEYRHTVILQAPGPAVPDGDGGHSVTWSNLTPAQWKCSIEPATARDLERVAAGTVITTATHILTGHYHSGITTATRAIFEGAVYQVTGVSDPEKRHLTTIAMAVELVESVPLVDTSWAQAGWMQ